MRVVQTFDRELRVRVAEAVMFAGFRLCVPRHQRSALPGRRCSGFSLDMLP